MTESDNSPGLIGWLCFLLVLGFLAGFALGGYVTYAKAYDRAITFVNEYCIKETEYLTQLNISFVVPKRGGNANG